ncbi:hypothetical protein K3177_14690 [Qipengyuania sp. GH25]|uniref:Uncharacterized protein n=1 Tax=Qipengyuania pacifica TaxID=2860199 RepID=A0ABS7JK43_9SPHN|nr:hypothetical protein [Qipengyuania aerophila]MBX7489753.1 hypothetical protein [Qipengyuania aerophila]
MKDEFRGQLREFVDMVRRELDEQGYGHIMLRPTWLKGNGALDPFLLEIPISPELVVSLRSRDIEDRETPPAIWDREAKAFAAAMITLDKGQRKLISYADEMRVAAVAEVEQARTNGLDIRLVGIGFKPIYAQVLDRMDREEALDRIVAEVKLEVTSFTLEREVERFTVEEPEDVADEIQDYVDDQRERQKREDELHRCRADLEISDIGIDVLRLAGRRPEEILAELYSRGSQDIVLDDVTRIGLRQDAGYVEVSLETQELYWNGKVLWLRKPMTVESGGTSTPTPLSQLITDQIFASRPVAQINNLGDGKTAYSFDETRFLFDAAEMRIRNKAKVAAKQPD